MSKTEHMSAAEYRNRVIEPSLKNAPMDEHEFRKAVKEQDLRNRRSAARKYLEPTEHEIQSAILERLAFLPKAFFWRENSGLIQVGEGSRKRYFRAGIPGIADIMGVYDGLPVAIEVKRPKKKQTADQVAFMRRFQACGGVAFVCTDAAMVVEQILHEIEGLGE